MLPDALTLLILAAASCIVVPVALVIRGAWEFADRRALRRNWTAATSACRRRSVG
jgi:hypothetical protein